MTGNIDSNVRSGKAIMAIALCSFAVSSPAAVILPQEEPQVRYQADQVFGTGFDVTTLYEPELNEFGVTDLMRAAVSGDITAVRALLEFGADVNGKDVFGATALMRAAFHGHRELVLLLLNSGANVLAVADDGSTALGHAIAGDNPEVIADMLHFMLRANEESKPQAPPQTADRGVEALE